MAPNGVSSRQKSCNACVRSKRRCDKRTPACGNCTRKRYLCVYGGQLNVQSYNDCAGIPMCLDSLAGSPPGSGEEGFVLDDVGFSTAFGAGIAIPSDMTLQMDSAIESMLGSMIGNGLGDTTGESDILSHNARITRAPPSKALSREDYSKMLPMCDGYAPWQLSDPSTRVAYAMNVFKNFHATFARDNCTIYMHPRLYASNPPRWVLQAFSVCVLYTNQTEATRGFVVRIIYENVKDLIETAGSTALTPQEKLARVHALMVYQTIRMFDGDVTLGQQADDDISLQETWNGELGKIRDNLEEFAELDIAEIRQRPPESWERWLFAESVRRTYIMCSVLKTYWDLLKGRTIAREVGNWRYIHRWSLSKHLWTATDPLEFFQAWKEKPMWIIPGFYLDDFLRTGTADDADEFALVFLTLTFGVNEMKMFRNETTGQSRE
ncbi:hypothetical protein F5Y04DRAFT_244671 [Hypomontagnella monticulosa]|nr:hypothetical protein F5Y04DRAFT_244671 [Hypomontagnella monticulosa]